MAAALALPLSTTPPATKSPYSEPAIEAGMSPKAYESGMPTTVTLITIPPASGPTKANQTTVSTQKAAKRTAVTSLVVPFCSAGR